METLALKNTVTKIKTWQMGSGSQWEGERKGSVNQKTLEITQYEQQRKQTKNNTEPQGSIEM